MSLFRAAASIDVVTSGADGCWSEPARRVDVVDLRGAGEAFAAGYLAGECRGWDATRRLQSGHFLASRVISRLSDVGPRLDPPGELESADYQLSDPDRMDAP